MGNRSSISTSKEAGMTPQELGPSCSRTTTLAVIGVDVIYIGADGRSCFVYTHKNKKYHKFENRHIAESWVQKIVEIRKNMLVTWAGDSETCKMFFDYVKARVGKNDDLMKAREVAITYIVDRISIEGSSTSKKKVGKPNDAVLLLCGWCDKQPTVYKVGIQDGKLVTGEINQVGQSISSGSGEEHALSFVQETMENRQQSLNSDGDYIEMVAKSIVVASLQDCFTGGYIRTCYVKKNTSSAITVKGHVVNLLRNHMNELESKVQGGVFVLTEAEDKYVGDMEFRMQDAMRDAGKRIGISNRLDECMVTLGVRKEESNIKILRFIKVWKQENPGSSSSQDIDIHKSLQDLSSTGEYRRRLVGRFYKELPAIDFAQTFSLMNSTENNDL